MNHDYDDYDNYYTACVREAIDDNRRRDREVLAALLTRLRKRGDFPSTDYTTGYQDALDQIAEARSLHTVTEVRYTV